MKSGSHAHLRHLHLSAKSLLWAVWLGVMCLLGEMEGGQSSCKGSPELLMGRCLWLANLSTLDFSVMSEQEFKSACVTQYVFMFQRLSAFHVSILALEVL